MSSTYHCSITRLRVRSLRFLPQFFRLSEANVAQISNSEGFIEGSLYSAWGLTFWTITLWKDERSMRAYMLNGAHKRSMKYLSAWCCEASVAGLQTHELPHLAAAHRMMISLGRASQLERPNRAHVNFELGSAPRIYLRRPLKSKADAALESQASAV